MPASPGRPRGRPRAVVANQAPDGEAKSDSFFIRSLLRGLMVLSLFDSEHPEWSLNDLARRASLGKTTTYRILRTMELARYLVFNPVTSTYHVGPALFPVSYLVQAESEIARVARPFLEEVVEKTHETVALAVEVDGAVIIIDQRLTPHFFKPASPSQWVLNDLGNANGKIFAAYKSDEERRALLAGDLPQLTPHTLTDPEELEREFERIRREGVAYDIEEQRLLVCAVGVPVFGALGEVKAVLTLVAPKERFGPGEMRLCTDVVKTVGAKMSASFGYQGPKAE